VERAGGRTTDTGLLPLILLRQWTSVPYFLRHPTILPPETFPLPKCGPIYLRVATRLSRTVGRFRIARSRPPGTIIGLSNVFQHLGQGLPGPRSGGHPPRPGTSVPLLLRVHISQRLPGGGYVIIRIKQNGNTSTCVIAREYIPTSYDRERLIVCPA
jgi:hypothetical protein